MAASLERLSVGNPESYDELPKNIGEVPSEQLLEIARKHTTQVERIDSPAAAARLHAIAGSAYIEASLVNNDMEVDVRLACLDAAEAHLRGAADGERALSEGTFYNLDDRTDWFRAELNYDFVDIYRDIVCGEVTERTTQEICEKLRSHMRHLESILHGKTGSTAGSRRSASGLRNELVVLLQTWESYANNNGSSIAFPSTARGGSGIHRPNETHDIVFAWQNDKEGWDFSAAEIKSGDGRTIEALTRYKNTLMFVDSNENIRVFQPFAA